MTSLAHKGYALRLLRKQLNYEVLTNSSPSQRAYNTYIQYVALKQHFNSWAFNWRLENRNLRNFDFITMNKRADSDLFYRFAEHLPDLYLRQQQMISVFLCNPNAHIFDIFELTDELAIYHKQRMSTLTKLTRILQKDLANIQTYIVQYGTNIAGLLKPEQYAPAPLLVTKVEELGLSLETLALLDRYFNFTRFKTVSPLWERNRLKICKYAMLINFDLVSLQPEVDNLLSVN